MKRATALLLGGGLGVLVLLATAVLPASADDLTNSYTQPGIKQVTPKQVGTLSGFRTTQADTVYVGYSAASADPNKVGVGGVWDFDTGTAGTDSTQFWKFILGDWRFESTGALPTNIQRPFWYLDHGNETSVGDQNLWEARDLAGTEYRRHGVIGVWHVDDLTGVGLDGQEGLADALPIAGSRSAWCGLRAAGDVTVVDEVTGNAINGELQHQWRAGGEIQSAYPGFGNQWDQILYRDVTVGGLGGEILTFRLRAELSDAPGTEPGGSGWFTPDPTSHPANFVTDPVDSFQVYVGLPKPEGSVYDLNRRWLSEVLDYGSAIQPQKLFATTGTVPVSGVGDTTVALTIPNLGGATTIRIAFQVKTNRNTSDEITAVGGFNSVSGAAVIDDVTLAAANIGDFESASDIRPRRAWNGTSWVDVDPASAWIATAKPPNTFGHIHNVFDLPYDDPCGALGSPDRICNLIDNVLVGSNHDDPQHDHFQESWNLAVSPTIRFDPGNPQGTDAAVIQAGNDLFRVEYDLFTGTMDLDQGMFFMIGARYMDDALPQPLPPTVAAWSGHNFPGAIAFSPDPVCGTFNTDIDLDGLVPPPSQLDSLQFTMEILSQCARFASTQCGATQGTYFDNIRACFTGGLGAGASALFWNLLQDTFPFNESVTPGSVDFDTTTALIKQALNNGATVGGEGVIIGDTLAYISAYAGNDTRLDLVFRILPGPGNYSIAGDVNSTLIEKDPSRPFWATYLANNGPVGTPGGHGGTWDPNVWNSARMDSSEVNLWPIVGRDLGTPVQDQWQGTLHESDPNFATLGIDKNVCFLVDPTGPADNSNICCDGPSCAAAPFFDSYPPAAYGPLGGDEISKEGTKILPDGYFSPGTHIEYFVRRSNVSNTNASVSLSPDTTIASAPQPSISHFDQFRFLEVAVLPDLWKDSRFGGTGLACMLVVDAADRRGSEPSLIGALDSLGYGKNSGAGRGWKEVNPGDPDPDDPAGFIALNQGQKGLSFDWYDINASESKEGGRLGCRLATAPPGLQDRQCKQGPTPDMLKTYYTTVLWFTEDLSDGAVHDGISSQEQSDDAAILQDFLNSTSAGNERALWGNGEGITIDLQTSAGNAPTLLSAFFGANFVEDNYRAFAGNFHSTAIFDPTGAAFHPAREYGINNFCLNLMDIIAVNPSANGAVEAARYEDQSHRPDPSLTPGTFTASVYRPNDGTSRFYDTLLDGFSFSYLRGNGPGESSTDIARLAWMDDALTAFNLCSRVGPVIAVGEVPGANGAMLNFVRGSFPNPSVTGAATVQFSLAQPANVSIRFYNVAGRLVHEARLDGLQAGANTYRWDGMTASGMRAPSGVYFYRLNAPGITFRNNSQRMVLLGSAN